MLRRGRRPADDDGVGGSTVVGYECGQVVEDGFEVVDAGQVAQAEISGACFVGDDVVVSTSAEPNEPDGPDDLGPNMLARWSMTGQRFLWRPQLSEPAGDLLPIGNGVPASPPVRR